jgi:hypothetical protein
MIERKLRYTLSAVAWVAAFMSGLALFSSAVSVATTARVHAAPAGAPHQAP